jgi:hypothetical protein
MLTASFRIYIYSKLMTSPQAEAVSKSFLLEYTHTTEWRGIYPHR